MSRPISPPPHLAQIRSRAGLTVGNVSSFPVLGQPLTIRLNVVPYLLGEILKNAEQPTSSR
jgi:hypothetical protein